MNIKKEDKKVCLILTDRFFGSNLLLDKKGKDIMGYEW
jgi:thymidylate kinase